MSGDTTTGATSNSLFGWKSPGRNIAIIVVVTLFGVLIAGALFTGAIGQPAPVHPVIGRTGFVESTVVAR